MQATFNELGIELLKYGYRKVVFLEVQCKIDGTFRLGVSPEALFDSQFECPKCHSLRPCSGIIATGYSRQSLPLEEFWSGPGDWDEISIDEYRPPKPKPGVDGRARHYRTTVHVGAPDESCAMI